MTKSSIVIVIKSTLKPNNTYTLSTISIDSLDKLPFDIKTMNSIRSPQSGDMFEILDKSTWKFKSAYSIHTYELATVLGEDKENHTLLVYGGKIGEETVAIENNRNFYQRGDLLLLNEYARNKFEIVHNITQAIMKYNIEHNTNTGIK